MKRIVFSDFDGTIMDKETFYGVLPHFVPGIGQKIVDDIHAQRISIRQGTRLLLESIPSSQYHKLISSVDSASIRPGFESLLDFLDRHEVKMVVVSGGLIDIIKKALGKLASRILEIHALQIDSSLEKLKVFSKFESETDLMAKGKVMELYSSEEIVAIGDSVTDIQMALKADCVFARDRLCQYLDGGKKSYYRWHDFFDIRNQLEMRWK